MLKLKRSFLSSHNNCFVVRHNHRPLGLDSGQSPLADFLRKVVAFFVLLHLAPQDLLLL